MKTILITGGNSGIGYATAALAKARSYEVTISGRDQGRVAEASEALGVRGIVADMSKPDDLQKLADYYTDSGLDGLVNNAGIARFLPITAHTEADYDEFFNTNIRGPMVLTQLLAPALAKNGGAITNVSSAITNNGLPNASLYAATKGALNGFSRSLAIEFAAQGIRVNCVSPGAIDTPIIFKLGIDPQHIDAIKAQQEAMIPLQRYGKPEEVAEVILAQIESSYVTGSVWSVDGGVDAT